jgi:hypothetical protein
VFFANLAWSEPRHIEREHQRTSFGSDLRSVHCGNTKVEVPPARSSDRGGDFRNLGDRASRGRVRGPAAEAELDLDGRAH